MILNTLIAQDAMILISPQAHDWAAQFCQHQANPEKAEQVYLNTLAVWTVHTWLQQQGIESDLTAGQSWDPIFQTCMNVADLVLMQGSRLECRPVLEDGAVMSIPAETWENRRGFVGVGLDGDLTQGQLLGYVPVAIAESVPLTQLQPVEQLLSQLQPQPPVPALAPSSHLGGWLQNQVEQGWETLETLLGLKTPAFSIRSGSALAPTPSPDGARRGKLVTVSSPNLPQAPLQQVLLLVEIQPQSGDEMTVGISLGCPTPAERLPVDLILQVLDDAGAVVMQAQARSTERITVEFTGTIGDRFSLQVIWGNYALIEPFVI